MKLFKKFYDLCDELIVHNKVSRDCLIKTFHIPEEKISIIAHGAYQTYMTDTETERNSEIKEFLQFGFIRKYKGIDILLDAVALLEPDIRKRIHITIAGKQYPKLDGTDYQAMIKERKLEETVSFIKRHISDEELPAMFGRADFLLFPYRHIYGSGALLMAYTYKKPVIVSNIPAFVEETDEGRTGLIFESENPRALADAIRRAAALGEDERKQYQAAICELAAEKYNWEKSALDTAAVYKKQI